MNQLLFDKPKSIEELKAQYNIHKVSLVTSANLYPLVKGIEYDGNLSAILEKKREFPIKRKMDNAIELYTNDMLKEWEKAKKKLLTLKNRIKDMKKMDYNNAQTIDRIARIPFRYKKQFVEVCDKYDLNLALLEAIVLNPSLLVNARYDARKNLMELNPEYLEQHGMIRIGDSGVTISETSKTFIHEFGHCIWYNSLTEEDRRAWEGLSRFFTREQLTGDMSQYVVGEKKKFDDSTVYSPFYTLRNDLFVSVYARFNVREDWSECFLYYKVDPKTLNRVDKSKFAFLEEKVGRRIEKGIKKQDEEEEEEYSPEIEEPNLVRDKIIATLYGLKDDLSDKAKEHVSSAYNLGRQKGVYYTGAAFLTAMQQKDKERVQAILDRNDKFLDGFMDDMVDEFDDVLFTKTPAGMIESERAYDDINEFDSEFTDVMDNKEHRLGLYAVNGLSIGLMAGMMSEVEDQYAGGIWHTSSDDRVCDGCDKLDGMWMSFDEFETLHGNNECDGNCRCGELFEPTLAPGDSMEMMTKGGPGSGRFPKGSTTKLTYQEQVDYDKLSEPSKVDYMEHRRTGMDHESALAFAEPDKSYVKKVKLNKNGQNAYAVSGDIGSTIREMNPQIEEKSIAVDYHGTLNIDGAVNEVLKNKLIEMKNLGYHIFIHTSGITDSPGAIHGITNWLQVNEIPYDEIWQRAGKPNCDAYIDDKSIRPNEIGNSEV